MSAKERDQWARLDVGIDALLAGAPLDPADDADGLLATARLVRVLPSEPDWPAADYPAQLATGLAAALRPTVVGQPSLLVPNGAAMRPRAAAPDAPHAAATTRRWWRQAAQLAAALAAFGLVGLVLVLVFRSGGGHDDGSPPLQLGASPAGVCQPSTPLISATTGELTYFVGDQDSQKIYRAAPDGSDAIVMQEHAGVDDFTLSWSPDGSQFAYVNSETDASGKVIAQAVMVASADGQSARRLTGATQAIESEPVWSPTGDAIAYASAGGHGAAAIYSVAPDGVGAVRLSPNDGAAYSHPLWSPDGRQIAFLRDGALMVVSADGTSPHRLRAERVVAGGFAWAPDSCRLAFSSESNGSADIYVIDADGGDARPVTSGDADDWSPAWLSNDELVFARQELKAADPEFAAEIYLIHADGSDIHKLDGLPRVKQKTPVVAPDGTRLAFAGFNYDTQHWEQYVVDLDSGHLQRMVGGIMPGALTPAWRPQLPPDAPRTPTPAPPTPTPLPTPVTSGRAFALSASWPLDIAAADLGQLQLGADGNLYVADFAHRRILVFSPDGTPQRSIDLAAEFGPTAADDALRGFLFAIAGDGTVIATNSLLTVKVAPDGTVIQRWDQLFGRQEVRNRGVASLAIDSSDNVYACEAQVPYGGSIVKFDSSGAQVGEWEAGCGRADASHALILHGDTLTRLTFGHAGVGDVQTFDLDGNLLGPAVALADPSAVDAGEYVLGGDLTSDAAGNVYLADSRNRQVIVWGPDGALIARWDPDPQPTGGEEPLRIAVAPDGGRVFIAAGDRQLVRVFVPDGPQPSEPATVSLSPVSGSCATIVTVYGKNFAPNIPVMIAIRRADRDAFDEFLGPPADKDGSVAVNALGLQQAMGCESGAVSPEGTQFVVRVSSLNPSDPDVLSATNASATFTYLGETPALLTVTPSVGACDTPVVASGEEFTAGTALAIYVNVIGGHEPALAANATVAGDGTFSAALDVSSIRACAPGFNPDAIYVVSASPDAGKLGNGIPGRSAGTLFFAARDVPVAVATRERLPFCGADPEVARQFIDPADAPLICLRDAAARGATGEMVTRAITSDGETIKLFRASGGLVEVITATRASDELQYAWTRQTCANVEVSVQPISVSGCSAVEQLPLAR